MDLGQVLKEGGDEGEGVSFGLNPKDGFQLAGGDQDASGVANGALTGDLANRGGGHQRDDGDRADGQGAAGAEGGVEDDRQEQGVDPGLEWQACDCGISIIVTITAARRSA